MTIVNNVYYPYNSKKKSKLKHTFDDELTYLKVPCGKCIECRKARVNQWFVRLSQELKRSTTAYFVTLTYDEEYLPYTDNLNDTLNYNDLVKFFKRLRKKQAKKHTSNFISLIVLLQPPSTRLILCLTDSLLIILVSFAPYFVPYTLLLLLHKWVSRLA